MLLVFDSAYFYASGDIFNFFEMFGRICVCLRQYAHVCTYVCVCTHSYKYVVLHFNILSANSIRLQRKDTHIIS